MKLSGNQISPLPMFVTGLIFWLLGSCVSIERLFANASMPHMVMKIVRMSFMMPGTQLRVLY
jgi:hypothetical protein